MTKQNLTTSVFRFTIFLSVYITLTLLVGLTRMGDSSMEVTDENREAAQAKGKAMEAISEGNFDEAIEHLTRAITLNPTSAILYGNQATVYIKLNKPNAAIRDANAALEINPDSAKGYKSRGMARAMLGEWAGAAKDLHLASTIDYDEEISVVLKKAAYDKAKKEEQSSSSRPFSIFQVS